MESDCFCICLPTWLWVRTAWSQHETHPKPVLQVKEQNTASINHIYTGSQSSWKCVEWKPWSQILPWTRQDRPAWHLLVGLDKGKRGRTREHQSQNWWLLHDTTITSITSSKKWQTNAEKWLWPFHSICLRRIEMGGTWTNYETAVSLEFFRVLSWYSILSLRCLENVQALDLPKESHPDHVHLSSATKELEAICICRKESKRNAIPNALRSCEEQWKLGLPNRCRWECWWCEMLLRVSLVLIGAVLYQSRKGWIWFCHS